MKLFIRKYRGGTRTWTYFHRTPDGGYLWAKDDKATAFTTDEVNEIILRMWNLSDWPEGLGTIPAYRGMEMVT